MKKIIVSALMALTCGVLFAEDKDMYLYWMIDSGATLEDRSGNADSFNKYGVRIAYSDSGKSGYLNLYDYDGAAGVESFEDATHVQGWDTLAGVGGLGDSTSFLVELFNGDELAYRSDSVSYGTLGAYISSMKGQARPADTYAFSNFMAVPEPTSGMLLLLGIAGLALKRKRA